jgi:hypothetical protein
MTRARSVKLRALNWTAFAMRSRSTPLGGI